MRIAVPAVLLACLFAAPAYATQGLRCAPASAAGPVLTLTIGSGATVVGASLAESGSVRSTIGDDAELRIGQSWIDAGHLWLDLTDADAMRYEARLRVAFNPKLRGRSASGTIERNGRTWTVRCAEA